MGTSDAERHTRIPFRRSQRALRFGRASAARPRHGGSRWCVRALTRLVAAAGALVVVSLVSLSVGQHSGRYRLSTVLSGSMRPAFSEGDVLVATPVATSKLRVGDVLIYTIPIGDHHVEAHRITTVTRRRGTITVTTRGDANTVADPWRARLTSATAWRERAVIPKLGLLLRVLQTPLVNRVTVLLAPALLAASLLAGIWRPSRPTVHP